MHQSKPHRYLERTQKSLALVYLEWKLMIYTVIKKEEERNKRINFITKFCKTLTSFLSIILTYQVQSPYCVLHELAFSPIEKYKDPKLTVQTKNFLFLIFYSNWQK